jgi:hypothetical protein
VVVAEQELQVKEITVVQEVQDLLITEAEAAVVPALWVQTVPLLQEVMVVLD